MCGEHEQPDQASSTRDETQDEADQSMHTKFNMSHAHAAGLQHDVRGTTSSTPPTSTRRCSDSPYQGGATGIWDPAHTMYVSGHEAPPICPLAEHTRPVALRHGKEQRGERRREGEVQISTSKGDRSCLRNITIACMHASVAQLLVIEGSGS
jgi:hypothetical protein